MCKGREDRGLVLVLDGCDTAVLASDMYECADISVSMREGGGGRDRNDAMRLKYEDTCLSRFALEGSVE